MWNFQAWEAEGEGLYQHVKSDQGDQAPVDHGDHPGLLRDAEQLHDQEDPAGDGCQGRGPLIPPNTKNMFENM
jgi:hypothetical protein